MRFVGKLFSIVTYLLSLRFYRRRSRKNELRETQLATQSAALRCVVRRGAEYAMKTRTRPAGALVCRISQRGRASSAAACLPVCMWRTPLLSTARKPISRRRVCCAPTRRRIFSLPAFAVVLGNGSARRRIRRRGRKAKGRTGTGRGKTAVVDAVGQPHNPAVTYFVDIVSPFGSERSSALHFIHMYQTITLHFITMPAVRVNSLDTFL